MELQNSWVGKQVRYIENPSEILTVKEIKEHCIWRHGNNCMPCPGRFVFKGGDPNGKCMYADEGKMLIEEVYGPSPLEKKVPNELKVIFEEGVVRGNHFEIELGGTKTCLKLDGNVVEGIQEITLHADAKSFPQLLLKVSPELFKIKIKKSGRSLRLKSTEENRDDIK